MGFPQNVFFTPEDEAALDAAVDEWVAECEAKRQHEAQQQTDAEELRMTVEEG
jgi:hypothetical protein